MQLIADVRASDTSYATLAAVALLVWDTIIHFGDEVELIWKFSNGWFRWLYCFVRYFPLAVELALWAMYNSEHQLYSDGNTSNSTCENSSAIESGLLEAVVLAVEIVLIVRVYVLYDRSKRMLGVILALFATSVALAIVGMILASNNMHFDGLCIMTSPSYMLIASWLAPVAFETLLFILTLVKFAESARAYLGHRPILHVIVRDGTWAYALAFMIMVLNTVEPLIRAGLSAILYFWAMSILSFIGVHVLLNLRRLAREIPISSTPSTFSDPVFENMDLRLPVTSD